MSSDSENTVREFIELFLGRSDAWGADAGRCVREQVTHEHWTKHLYGSAPLGIYPLLDDGRVHWGCVDIDLPHKTMAVNLWRALLALKLPSWIERSKSKGHHVWVFADEWVPAGVMRNALLVACQVADVPPKEVNPKQTELPEGGLGNYVRVPYVGTLDPLGGERTRQVMVYPDESEDAIAFSEFVGAAYRHRALTKNLLRAQRYLAPTQAPREVRIVEPSRLDSARLPKLARIILDEGPLDGADRSGTLLKLAVVLRDSGVDPGAALGYVRDADARWGKFSKRHDGEEQLRRLIERVYR